MNTIVQGNILTAMAVAFMVVANGDEPQAKAPQEPAGWQGIAFGDSFEEALDKLGTKAVSKSQLQQPQMEHEALNDLAERLIRESKKKDLPDALVKACRDVKRLSSPRTWIDDQKQRVTAEIQGVNEASVVVKASKNRILHLTLESLDAESRQAAGQYAAAAQMLTAFARTGGKEGGGSPSVSGPDDLAVMDTDVEGIALKPQLFFTPGFSAVSLSKHYSNNGATTGVRDFDKIAKRLKKQFGEPSKIVSDNRVKRHAWRLPTTVISLEMALKEVMVPRFVNNETSLHFAYSHDLVLKYSEPDDNVREKAFEQPQAVRHARGAAEGDTLRQGQELTVGQELISKDGRYSLKLRQDGDLVLERIDPKTQRWSSGTGGSNATKLALQQDGNLVISRADGSPVWSSQTAGRRAKLLVVQVDGNVVLYENDNFTGAAWTTNSQE